MLQKKLKQTALLLVLTLLATTMATAQTVNMSRYITLTVRQGQQIKLDFEAAAEGTPVKIVSGSTNQTITVGISWTGDRNYTAGATTMTVYGDITAFDCAQNGANLTALDVSHNTALKTLYCFRNQLTSLDVSRNTALKMLECWGNNFTTQAFNDLMCSLPSRTTAADNAGFYPLWNASSAGASAFMAANSQIATAKNWLVRYGDDNGAIPATTGTYVCLVNMSRYITLTVQQGQPIRLDLQAAAAGTGVKIVSGSTNQTITVDTSWTGFQNYTAGSTTMTVYGDITGFDCSGNGTKLTALDVSQNTELKRLDCYSNNFTTQAFNDLMCSLPARVAGDNARFYPLRNASDAGVSAFMATNAQIATGKSWQVRYLSGGVDIPATTGTYTCPTANMNKYITLTVTQGQQIQLDLKAAAEGTLVKIVSGSTEQTITVGTDWTDFQNYTAGATTMTVYGDITGFRCSDNGTKLTALNVSQNTALTRLDCYDNRLTALDVSQNTALVVLNCYGNNFTTQAFNDLMCSLPARTTATTAVFRPLYGASDAGISAFMAANSQIATAKNWLVRYHDVSGAIPPTTGTYTCPVVNMSRYITLTVQQGQQIRLDLRAAAAGTKVKVVSGSTETEVTVGTSWTNFQNYTAGATTMTVYGDITGFDCSNNGTKLTSLNVSHNTALTGLYCGSNQLTSLNVSQNTALTWLYCYGNQLTALDVSQNTALTELYCYGNRLTALDVSQNTALKELYCNSNQLTSLDVTQNTALTRLECSGNNFTTQAFNDLMCSLPARTAADNAKFFPLYDASDAAASAFMAANSQIATGKSWQVRYRDGSGDIPATTGTYTCPVVNMSRYITLTVQQGQQITLNLWSAAAGTKVKVVSGSTNQNITVGTSGTGYRNYTAGATTMTVYGDITGFYCSDNGTKLTALNVSHNTALKELYCSDNQLTSLDVSQNTALTRLLCHGNRFTTQAFNDLMCSLPARTTANNAKFYPLLNASGAGVSAFMASNSQIATAKNWQVRYWEGSEAAIPATTGTYVCGGGSGSVNMSRYITLTVQQGQQIQLDLIAAAAGTKVKVVSGSTETEVTVDTDWTGYQNYTAGSTTMTVYGDIIGFDCSDNGTKLTALDLSHNTELTELYCQYNQITSLDVSQNTALTGLGCGGNRLTSLDVSQNTALTGLGCSGNRLTSLNVSHNTALKKLVCYGNRFTTQAFNDIMCSLPARTTADDAEFYPLWNASDAGYATFMAANAQIAKNKNWQVCYGVVGDIPATTGTYTCPVVNMSRYITLTVTQGQQIKLALQAVAAGTKVKVVSGSNETEVTVGTDWTDFQNYTAGATTMTIYGDITGFDCSGNGTKLTALDVSHNTALTGLYCQNNQLTSLNVSHNTALTELGCNGNQLTALDVSHNTALTGLGCGGNRLTSLDVSQNTALTELWCHDNSFTTQAFNDLMCSLPARTAADNARFYPLRNASDAGASAFMAANAQIATAKNWQVRYGAGGDIPATTGTYVCGGGTGIAEIASVPLTVYPNPATDILTVETEATGSVITLTDLTGRTVLTATATAGKTTLNVSELSAGTYIVRVGDRVGKVVKR